MNAPYCKSQQCERAVFENCTPFQEVEVTLTPGDFARGRRIRITDSNTNAQYSTDNFEGDILGLRTGSNGVMVRARSTVT